VNGFVNFYKTEKELMGFFRALNRSMKKPEVQNLVTLFLEAYDSISLLGVPKRKIRRVKFPIIY
jgi:hypothetical protein